MAKYKAYPVYKDSGVEWIGKIPSHWEVASLSKLFSIKAGGDVQQNLFSEVCSDEYPYPIYTNANDEFAVYGYTKKANYQSNTITVSGRGDVGFAVYRNHAYDAIIRLLVLAPLKQLECKFYSYFINSVIDFKVESSAIGQLSTQQISPYKSVIPSRVEQRNITTFLGYETAKIDNLIEKQQQLIELLKEKRQAVISHVVTKGLNPDVTMKDSGVEWLGEVPKHWDVLRLKHLISYLESGCSVNAADIPAQQGEVAVLKTSCVYTRSFRANENKTVVSEDLHRIKCPVRKGSIIISRMNTPDLVGASALVDVDVENIYLPDRLWQTNFNPKFKLIPAYLAHFMTTQGFRTQISLGAEGASSSMQNIAKDDYLSINCLLPSIEEQQEITSFLEEKLSYFSGLELMSSEIIKLLQERRTALISAAVTGKIDVRDWVAPDTQDVEEPQEATA